MTRGSRTRVMGLVRACHPAPTAVVTVLVVALAWAWGRDLSQLPQIGLAVLTGQLSIGWSNDGIDAHLDVAARRSTKPIVAGVVGARTVWMAACSALVVCVPLSLANGLLAGTVHLVGVASGWAYNLWLKGTSLSWLPYAVSFGSLPAFVSLGLPGEPWPPWWAIAVGALLGVGAHVANVLPDLASDLAMGIRGWPQRLGPHRARLMAPVPLMAAGVVLAFAPDGPVGTIGWTALGTTGLLAGGLVWTARHDRVGRMPFLATMAIAAVNVGLLLQRGLSA